MHVFLKNWKMTPGLLYFFLHEDYDVTALAFTFYFFPRVCDVFSQLTLADEK
jgi:hypothetical protein